MKKNPWRWTAIIFIVAGIFSTLASILQGENDHGLHVCAALSVIMGVLFATLGEIHLIRKDTVDE